MSSSRFLRFAVLKLIRSVMVVFDAFPARCIPCILVWRELFLWLPAIDRQGVKLAVHCKPGHSVLNPDEPVRDPNRDDAAEPLAIAARRLPRLAGALPNALD